MMASKETAVRRVDRKLRAKGTTLAEVCEVDRTRTTHWDSPTSKKNGRGGSIPDKYHRAILDASKKLRAGVTPEDLING